MATSKYKTRVNSQTYTQYPEKLEELKNFFGKINLRNGDKPLSKITVSSYANKLNRLAILITGKGWDGNDKWLLNPDKVIDEVSKSNLTGKKDMFSPVSKYLKAKDAHQDVISAYQKAMSDFKDGENKVRNQNKASKKEVDNSLSYPEVLKRINSYKPTNDMELIYKLIMSLYFQNSLVPRNDLPLMKFVSTSKKPKDMNDNFNYITLDKNSTPIDIIMNNYKSRNTYGRQKFTITPEVRTLLKDYIKEYGKKAGDWLFVMRNGEPFKKPNFADLIESASENVLGKKMNINLIRKIQITHYYKDRAKSIAEDEEDARRYLHSPQMHKEYLSLNLPDDE